MQTKSNDRPLPATSHDDPLPSHKRHHFAPTDDRRLLGSASFDELQEAIQAIANDTGYPLRVVARRAKKLGAWDKLAAPRRQFTIRERTEIRRLLSRCNTKEELLSDVAATLRVEKKDALRLLYRDPMLKESLAEGSYTLREVAQGLCMRPGTIKQFIVQGHLRARQLQPLGKIFITSDSISHFAKAFPRRIDWDRCTEKSPWLRDILESARIKELTELLCVSERKIQSWMRMGFLTLPFNQGRIGDLFGDEPIFRFLDEHQELVDFSRCSAKSPEWFARYAKVQGRHAKKRELADDERDADRESNHYLALRRR